jgi:hypothetical protein
MADTLEPAARETGVAKSTILRLIRPVPTTSSPETATLRAEVEGLRLALSIAQDALREERADKQHWRDEAKHLRQLLAAHKPQAEITLAPEAVTDAPALAPVADSEPDCPSTEIGAAESAGRRYRWWGRLFA